MTTSICMNSNFKTYKGIEKLLVSGATFQNLQNTFITIFSYKDENVIYKIVKSKLFLYNSITINILKPVFSYQPTFFLVIVSLLLLTKNECLRIIE